MGTPPVQFGSIPGVAVDASGAIYVLDRAGAVPISLDVVGLGRNPVVVAGGYQSVIVQNVQTAGRKAYLAEPFGSFFGPGEEGAYAVGRRVRSFEGAP